MTSKLIFWLRIIIFFTVNYFQLDDYALAQSIAENKYGLFVTNDTSNFKSTVDADTNKRMVDIPNWLPGIILDLKYATVNNFMNQPLYHSLNTTYLRKTAIEALQKVLKELKGQHLTIKIFDAYRPYSVTEKMWEVVKDDRYAADPAKGSAHNRGAAVDLTLVDIATKKELSMGTGFDNFSDTAHTDFTALPLAILKKEQY